MALSNDLREALARRRQPRSTGADVRKGVADCDALNPGTGAHRNYDQNIDGADEPDRNEPDSIPVTVGDPDNDIDPDDRAPTVIQQTLDLVSPPEMPAAWWIRMTLDPPDTVLTPEDVRLVFWHIQYRLAAPETATGAFPPLADVTVVCLLPLEGGDSGQEVSGDTAGELIDSVTTVGALHESVEQHFGPSGWTALVSLWQEAAGIQQPRRQPKTSLAPIIDAEPDGKPDTSLPPLPEQCFPLEEGLHRSLPEMPEKAAAFLLHVPRDSPAWRYQESAGERTERQALENLGAWTG